MAWHWFSLSYFVNIIRTASRWVIHSYHGRFRLDESSFGQNKVDPDHPTWARGSATAPFLLRRPVGFAMEVVGLEEDGPRLSLMITCNRSLRLRSTSAVKWIIGAGYDSSLWLGLRHAVGWYEEFVWWRSFSPTALNAGWMGMPVVTANSLIYALSIG